MSQLANSTLKLIAQCQDLTCLMSECGEEEVDPSWLVDHVKSQMLFRPSLSGFTLLEVMESLLCQKASSCLESEDWPGLLRLSRLVTRLGPEVGLDMTGVLEERETVRKEVTSAELSWALHQSGLLSLESQWKCLSKASMERYLSDVLEQSQEDREVGAGIVRAGMSLVVSESRTALTLLKSLLLFSRDSERELRFDWLEMQDRKWAQFGLETVLGQQERGDLMEAVKNHRAWQTSTDRGPGSLILALVRSCGQSEAVYRQVSRAVMRKERFSWRLLLLLLSVCVEEFPASRDRWNTNLREMLGAAVAEEDQEKLQGTLLLARQSVSNYSSWLGESLSEQSPVITSSSKRGLVFIIQCLTDLVPHQSVDMLRDHLDLRPTGLVRTTVDQWRDYEALVRSRRRDLAGDQATIDTGGLNEDSYTQARAFIQDFARIKKIPSKLMEISNFKRPLFDRQVVPALMTVELSPELEESRDLLLASLADKNKLAAHLYQKYKSGQLTGKASQEDSSEQNVDSLLGVLSILGSEDTQQIKQLCKRLVSVITTLLQPFECEVNLDNILNRSTSSGDSLPQRVFQKVFKSIRERREWSGDLLSLLICSSPMLVRSVQHLLDNSDSEDIKLPLTQLIVESGKDQVEVGEGKKLSVLELLCSRYNTVADHHQLSVVEKILTKVRVREVTSVRRKYLENRREIVSGRDSLHLLKSIAELGVVLEMELSIKIAEQDKTPLLLSLLAMFDLAVADHEEVARLVERLVAVCRCTGSQTELKTVMEVLGGRVRKKTWVEVYRLVSDRHSDLMLTLWNMVPGLSLSRADLQLAVAERKEDWRLCLPLKVTRFLLLTVPSTELKGCSLAELSVGYWSARRHLPPPGWLDHNPSLLAWADSSHTSAVRLGVVLLAEQYLSHHRPLSSPDLSSNPVLVKLSTLQTKHGPPSIEDQLAPLPSVWWPGVTVSDKLDLACSLLVLHLYTSVFSPSIGFTINTLLHLLSRLMDSFLDCIQDCDINQVQERTVNLILSQPPKKVSSLIKRIRYKVNPDIKRLLNTKF